MTGRIPDEIECEIASDGGLSGIASGLPPGNELEALSRLHYVLSDTVRLGILLSLHGRRLCVCVLRELSFCSNTRLSYHLSQLRKAGLVTSVRDRSYLRYYLTLRGRQVTVRLKGELQARRKK